MGSSRDAPFGTATYFQTLSKYNINIQCMDCAHHLSINGCYLENVL